MSGECMGSEQSCIGFLVWLVKKTVFHVSSFPQPVIGHGNQDNEGSFQIIILT